MHHECKHIRDTVNGDAETEHYHIIISGDHFLGASGHFTVLKITHIKLFNIQIYVSFIHCVRRGARMALVRQKMHIGG
jgi:hypothetical protein